MRHDADPAAPLPARASSRRFVVFTVAIFAAFLLGLVPMWLTSRDRARELTHATQQLRAAHLQNLLASAALDARRGDYELARQSASRFFTEARAEADRGSDSAFPPDQVQQLERLFRERDEVITLLARSDPAAAERLSDLFVSFRATVQAGEEHAH
jgi:acyl-CoA synthetase (AMP-forming)/AMP-acid ligase II